MYNQVNLIGRLIKDPEIAKTKTFITLEIQRSYRNANGEYEADFIDCTLPEGIAHNVVDYCKKGDLLSVRGQFITKAEKQIEIIVEKVIFLTSKDI